MGVLVSWDWCTKRTKEPLKTRTVDLISKLVVVTADMVVEEGDVLCWEVFGVESVYAALLLSSKVLAVVVVARAPFNINSKCSIIHYDIRNKLTTTLVLSHIAHFYSSLIRLNRPSFLR